MLITCTHRIPPIWAFVILNLQVLLCKFIFYKGYEGKFLATTNRLFHCFIVCQMCALSTLIIVPCTHMQQKPLQLVCIDTVLLQRSGRIGQCCSKDRLLSRVRPVTSLPIGQSCTHERFCQARFWLVNP